MSKNLAVFHQGAVKYFIKSYLKFLLKDCLIFHRIMLHLYKITFIAHLQRLDIFVYICICCNTKIRV